MDEKFCLKWNDFESNISKSFAKLRGETQLFDVTLVGHDQRKVSAHRLHHTSEHLINGQGRMETRKTNLGTIQSIHSLL